jgi:hypothetical protein
MCCRPSGTKERLGNCYCVQYVRHVVLCGGERAGGMQQVQCTHIIHMLLIYCSSSAAAWPSARHAPLFQCSTSRGSLTRLSHVGNCILHPSESVGSEPLAVSGQPCHRPAANGRVKEYALQLQQRTDCPAGGSVHRTRRVGAAVNTDCAGKT